MVTDIEAYQQSFRDISSATNLRRRYGNLAVGWTQPVQVAAPAGMYVHSVVLEASIALSATGSESATSSTDLIDEWLSGYEVAATSGGDPRLKAQNRTEAEIIEMLAYDTGNHGTQNGLIGSYPRSAAAKFSASGTRTDTSSLVVPIGGQAAWVKLQIPAITGVYAANVSVTSYTIGWTEMYTTWGGSVAAKGVTTPTLATGLQDITEYVPKGIAPNLVCIYGRTPGSDYDQLYYTNSGGLQTLSEDNTQALQALQNVYPRIANPPATQNTFALSGDVPIQMKLDVLSSESFSMVFLQITPAPATSPPASTTPALPDVSKTGTPTPGRAPTPSGGSSTAAVTRGRKVPYS